MTSRILLALLFMWGGVALAEDSVLRNGTFDQGGGDGTQIAVPRGWEVSKSAETNTEDWMKILNVAEGGISGVELKAVNASNPVFLYQDVDTTMYEKGAYLLRCKAKGAGIAEISVSPREGSGSFTGSSKKIDLEPNFQSYEIPVTIPDDSEHVRVILQTVSSDANMIVSQVELVPSK